MSEGTNLRPIEIKLKKDRKAVEVTFDNNESFLLSAEYLRIQSPSAEVQGHSPEQRVLVHGKINVQILKVEPIGNYAIKLTFDDLHDTGLFTWSYLYELGCRYDELWGEYLIQLKASGLTRLT